MNICRFDSQLWELGPKLAIYLIGASVAAIPLTIILGYICSRVLAAAQSERDEPGRRENKRRFRPAAVLITLIAAVSYIASDSSLITRFYGGVGKSRTAHARDIQVWVNKRSGLYYCPSTKLYGKLQPGKEMPEGSALQSGFRPALGQICR
jgi:hypothetical protein